jgi:PAS domain S-box-containing protein
MSTPLAQDALNADPDMQRQLERAALLNLESAEAQVGLGSWAFDVRTGSGWWSPQMYRLFGQDPAGGVPDVAHYLDLIHAEDRALIAVTMEQLMRGQQPAARDFRTSPDRGPVRILSPQYRVETDQAGAAWRFFGTLLDVTERRQAERALRARDEQYRGLMQSLDTLVAALDADGRLLYMNDRAAAQLGAGAEALVGRTLAEVAIAPTALFDLGQIQRAIAENRQIVYEAQAPTRDGQRWYRIAILPIHDGQGRPAHALINAADIDDLKATQQKLLELTYTLEERVGQRSAEVQDLYENAPNGYHSLDADGTITMINQTELAWLGYARDEVLGRPLSAFITAESQATFAENYLQFKQRGLLRDIAIEFVRKDGSTFPALVNATAIYDGAGTFLMSRSTVFDNTERKQVEDALRVANAEMERALRAKDAFLAGMSHELRTPLSAILALSESLGAELRGPLNQGQQEALRQIAQSGQHLLALIDDILDLSKVEVGQLDLAITAISISEICRASLQQVKAQALMKQQLLSFQLNDELADIDADPQRLKQMLVGLLRNAVKFTPAGGRVSLEVEVLPGEAIVRFMVRDTGLGIAPADLPQLFSPFTQLDTRLSRRYEGAGLGLALVRRLANLHGGSVGVESQPARGSCFTITLPYRPQAAGRAAALAPKLARAAPAQLAPTGAQILLVEDNAVNMEVVREYLQAVGYAVAVARTGREALAQAAAIQPALILMDIQMPEMDGLEAIQRLRARPECAATPIIAVTALAMAGDRERCLAAGANEYLSKPVSLRGLGDLIRRLLPR